MKRVVGVIDFLATEILSEVSNEQTGCNKPHGAQYDVIVCFNNSQPKTQKLINVLVH